MNEIFEKLHDGSIYDPNDEELMKVQTECLNKLDELNSLKTTDIDGQRKLLKEMFAEIGENCFITLPFYANWGGRHIHFGNNVYCNFGVTMVDDTHIYVGDNTAFGPNVTVATAAHPLDSAQRLQQLQYNKPVHIGKNCWIGANVVILPGVSIGDNSVIGAGSVVTKDIPSDVVAVGNPCRITKSIK